MKHKNINEMENLITEVLDDYMYRRRIGENPTLEEYTQKYPDFAEEIKNAFIQELKWVDRFEPVATEIHLVTTDFEKKKAWKRLSNLLTGQEEPKPISNFRRWIDTIFRAILNSVQKGYETISNLISPIPVPIRYALPSIVVVIITFYIILMPSRHYSDMARIERIPYIPITFKGGSEPQKLFSEGMRLYNEEKYPDTITKLEEALVKDPDNVNVLFYLGLCYLLNNELDEGIFQLQRVVSLGGNDLLLERSHWYLGNAYLLKDDVELALSEFQKVIEFEGDYEWEVREMVKKIR